MAAGTMGPRSNSTRRRQGVLRRPTRGRENRISGMKSILAISPHTTSGVTTLIPSKELDKLDPARDPDERKVHHLAVHPDKEYMIATQVELGRFTHQVALAGRADVVSQRTPRRTNCRPSSMPEGGRLVTTRARRVECATATPLRWGASANLFSVNASPRHVRHQAMDRAAEQRGAADDDRRRGALLPEADARLLPRRAALRRFASNVVLKVPTFSFVTDGAASGMARRRLTGLRWAGDVARTRCAERLSRRSRPPSTGAIERRASRPPPPLPLFPVPVLPPGLAARPPQDAGGNL